MGVLGATDIPYDKWMMFMGKIFGVWIVVGSVLMIAAEIIGYM